MNARGLAAVVLLSAAAAASADIDARAELGFGGRWVVDAATPLALDLVNTGAEPVVVEIVVSQGQGVVTSDVVQRRVVEIAAGAARSELFLVPGTRVWNGGARVELSVDPAVPIHSPTESADRGSLTFDVSGGGSFSADQIAYASRVLGVVGDTRGSVAARLRAAGLTPETQRDGHASSRIEAVGVPAEYLRLAPLGLDGLDAVVLCDPDAQTCADPAAAEGLLDWVALGGTLVVSLGEHAAQFTASPLAAEMPALWTGAVRTSYSGLIGDLGAKELNAQIDGPWVVLRPNELAAALDAATHDGAPVRAERNLGMGRIVVLPFDLRAVLAAPWLDEVDTRRLLAPVVGAPTGPTEDPSNQWNRADYSSAIGRALRTGAFEAPPLPLVVLGILVYVIVVGPLDWFVLKKLKKQRLTTLTFLGAVATFTLLAYGSSLFLFSTGARVNRIVVADLADAGRDGRQVLRFVDIAGYYSPTGSDQSVGYATPAAVVSAALPGSGMGGDVGSTLPVQVMSNDPLHPRAVVQLAFRSQRVVRVQSAGTLGSTIDVEWKDGGVRVTNGLPVDLDDVAVYTGEDAAYSLGPVRSGATSEFAGTKGTRDRTFAAGDIYSRRWGNPEPATPDEVRRLLEAMTIGSWTLPPNEPDLGRDERAAMRKSGIDRSAAFSRGHALVVALASQFPVALPGGEIAGDTYVVFRKEVEIR